MKIAFIGQKGVPTSQGGVEKHVQELGTRLVKAGHEVLIYARPTYAKKPTGQYYFVKGKLLKKGSGPRVIILPCVPNKYLETITHTFICIWHATWVNADVIHFQGDGPALLIWLARLLWPKTKIVATFHSIDRLHQKWGWLSQQALRFGEWLLCKVADQVICVGHTLQKYANKQYGCEAVYIPNGTSSEKISNLETQKILKDLKLSSGKYILMVSRLVRHKGAHHLIQAYKQLGKLAKNYDLVFVGAGAYTDDYVNELKDLAGDNKHIKFLGVQTGKKLSALYKGARVTVQPSESEGLSLVVLEALAQSPRVLVSDIPENREIINGLIPTFKSGRVADLTSQLKALLKSGAPEISAAVRGQLLAPYQWSKISKETIVLYRALLKKKETAQSRSEVVWVVR